MQMDSRPGLMGEFAKCERIVACALFVGAESKRLMILRIAQWSKKSTKLVGAGAVVIWISKRQVMRGWFRINACFAV